MYMKTSTKLLLGMLLLIMFLLVTGFIQYKNQLKNKKETTQLRKPINEKFDSLIVENISIFTLNKIDENTNVVSENATVNYKDNMLYISDNKNVILELADNIKFLKLNNINQAFINSINTDTLTIVSYNTKNIMFGNVKIGNLRLFLNKSTFVFENNNGNSTIDNIILDSNHSGVFVGENTEINKLTGTIDESSEVQIKGIKKVDLKLK